MSENPASGATVRRIVELELEGFAVADIAYRLNHGAYSPAPNGGLWSEESVRRALCEGVTLDAR